MAPIEQQPFHTHRDDVPIPENLRGMSASIFMFHNCPLLADFVWLGWEVVTPPFNQMLTDVNQQPYFLFKYTLSGTGMLHMAGATFALTPGTACLLEGPDAEICFSTATDTEHWEVFSLLANGGEAVAHAQYLRDSAGPVMHIPLRHQSLFTAGELFRQAYRNHQQDPYYVGDMLHHFFYSLHQRLGTIQHYGDQETVAMATTYIDMHYQEDLRVADIAREINVSSSYLYYLFKRHSPFTPMELLTQRRLQAVRELLRTTDLPLAAIAMRCGFNSASYLSNIFKTDMGLTPQAYRRQWRPEARATR